MAIKPFHSVSAKCLCLHSNDTVSQEPLRQREWMQVAIEPSHADHLLCASHFSSHNKFVVVILVS